MKPYISLKEVTLNSHVLHPSCACSRHPTNIFLVNILFSKYRSLHQCLITHNHCRCSGCVQPTSPDTAAVGVYFPTPRKYRHALHCTAFIQENDLVSHTVIQTDYGGLHYRVITFRKSLIRHASKGFILCN